MRDEAPLIDFVGVGPPKTGTTWLHACLYGHPELCLPQQKETHFFDRYYDRGLDWYRRQFKSAPTTIRGEIGASYFLNSDALERIHRVNEKAKVIVNLRDPVARTFSFYLHYHRKRILRGDFLSSLKEMPRLFESSRYEVLLPRWIERFGRDSVLIILLQDIAADPVKELQRVHGFIQVSEWLDHDVVRQRFHTASMPKYPGLARVATQLSTQMRKYNLHRPVDLARRIGARRVYQGGVMDRTLDPEDRALLIERFLPTIEYIEGLVARPLPEWRVVRREPTRTESSVNSAVASKVP